jgi:hypothetical protein
MLDEDKPLQGLDRCQSKAARECCDRNCCRHHDESLSHKHRSLQLLGPSIT